MDVAGQYGLKDATQTSVVSGTLVLVTEPDVEHFHTDIGVRLYGDDALVDVMAGFGPRVRKFEQVRDTLGAALATEFGARCVALALQDRVPLAPPLASGTYRFQHRDAEFSESAGFPVTVTIQGDRVTVRNIEPVSSLPQGVFEEATLMWHAGSRSWILGHSESDRQARDVGGCSDGPHTIDFEHRIIWTCEGGP